MSESGDTGEGPDDREAKRRKSSDPKQQEEEEKSIPPKGNESSSTANPSVKENTGIEQKPEEAKTEGSSGAQGSSEFERRIEQRIEQVFGRENIPRPVLPLKKRELHPTPRGYDPNLVVSLSESGQPELGRQLEQLENQPERLGRQPELPWSTEDLATIAVLIAIAGVKIQNASDNPFHSRPATMSIIFTALSIYGFAAAQTRPIILDGKQQQILMWRIIYYFYQLLNSLVLISKVVCQACIVSLFIPYVLGWNVYVACASTSCFGVAVWAILRNFAPSCVVRLVPCMGPTGSSGGRENNDGDSDSGNDGRNQIEESNASPVCGSSVVSENQSSSQQGGTRSSVPSHQTDHSTQAKRGLFLQPELGRQLEQLENQPERLGRQPELPWSTEDPAVVLATIAALIAIAGVKFQNASDNPFHSRPATMTSIFIALLIYGFAAAQTRPIILDGKQQKILMWRIIYYFYRLLNSLILISKVVCQACIVSLFIPYGLGWNVYVACASTSCFGVAVWAILRNFAPSCVVRLVPCMGPIGSSGGSENNDGDSDSGNDGRNRIEESNVSPVCGSSVVSENQSSSQQGGTSSSVPSHQTDHSTQADGKTANTGNAVLLHIIQSSPHKGTESEAHPNPDEKPIQSPKPLEVASQRSQAGPV